MTANYETAIDEVFGLFKTAWDAGSGAIVGYVPTILWPGLDKGVPDASEFYVRISTQQVGSNQSTLSENVVSQGSKRFESFGLIFVQIFAPKREHILPLANKLANFTQKIFRDKTENVILKNAKINELPIENGLIRINVITEFEFDEIS